MVFFVPGGHASLKHDGRVFLLTLLISTGGIGSEEWRLASWRE
jgi:hypothetical protein